MTLKCDLHLHTQEDPRHQLPFSSRDLIVAAAGFGYHVLSITNHNVVTWDEGLAAFARRQGILLIPGVEATVAGKHVLIYGVAGMEEDWGQLTFFHLKRLRSAGALVVAPHPFYPNPNCLGSSLIRHRTLFDAVEYSHLYTKRINFNRKAMDFARSTGIPLIGSSDAHSLRQLDYTYTLLQCSPESQEIFRAVREGRMEVMTKPARLSTSGMVGIQLFGTFLAMRLFQ